MTEPKMESAKATALRKPFPKESVGSLPKGGVMLDYVGHAAVTDRLLTVDPAWSWEPFAVGPDGLPAVDRQGNLWIRLTVCGVTRIGVGDGKSAKECIGDAIRNAAMRFGVALDLWAKENLVEFAQAASHPPESSQTFDQRANEDRAAAGVGPKVKYDNGGHVVLPTPAFKAMQAKTKGRLFALFAEHDIIDTEEQKRGISHIIGRQIVSRAELSDDEAKQVIAALAARPKPTAVPA